MGNFFDKRPADGADDEDQQDEKVITDEQPVDKIKVGEVEYEQQELDELVSLGKLGREMQTKYNTDFQKVWPEYTRTTQELKTARQAQEELENLKRQQVQARETGEGLDPTAVAKAKEAARKLGLILDEDIDSKVETKFRGWYQRERAAERLLDDCKTYEGKIDGKDGRPAFRSEEILQYMADTGIKDPQLAYKAKYEPQLDAWKEQQLGRVKRSGMSTIREGGAMKSPKEVKIDNSNVDELMAQALRGEI